MPFLKFSLLLGFFISLPSFAYANGAIPFTFMIYPVLWILIFPVIAIEIAVYKRLLKIPYRELFLPVLKANLLSTALGFLFGFLLLIPDVAILMVFLAHPLGETINDYLGLSLVLLSVFIITSGFLIFSVFIERRYLMKKLGLERAAITKSVWVSHFASYALMIVTVCCVAALVKTGLL